MGGVKNACHDELEAKRSVAEQMPEAARVFEAIATVIAPHLCASDRFKGDQWAIAADVLGVLDRGDWDKVRQRAKAIATAIAEEANVGRATAARATIWHSAFNGAVAMAEWPTTA